MCYFNNAKLQNNLQTTKYFMLKNQKIPTYSHEPVGIGFLQQEWVYLPLFLYQKNNNLPCNSISVLIISFSFSIVCYFPL